MQELPETPDKKRGVACTKKQKKKKTSRQKKESFAFSAVTSKVTTLCFLLLVEGPTRLSFG